MDIVRKFTGVSEFVRYIQANIDTPSITKGRNSSTDNDYEFRGTHSLQEAIDLVKNGDDRILAKLKEEVASMKHEYASEVTYLPSVHGLFFDVAKVIEGIPEVWYERIEIEGDTPLIEIKINIGYNWGVEVDTVIHNSAILLSYIKNLENKGYLIKLIGVNKTNNKNGTYYNYSVVIKDYHEGINYRKLSGVIHPSFFRRLIFRDKELNVPNLPDGYGRATTVGDIYISEEDTIHKYFKGVEND